MNNPSSRRSWRAKRWRSVCFARAERRRWARCSGVSRVASARLRDWRKKSSMAKRSGLADMVHPPQEVTATDTDACVQPLTNLDCEGFGKVAKISRRLRRNNSNGVIEGNATHGKKLIFVQRQNKGGERIQSSHFQCSIHWVLVRAGKCSIHLFGPLKSQPKGEGGSHPGSRNVWQALRRLLLGQVDVTVIERPRRHRPRWRVWQQCGQEMHREAWQAMPSTYRAGPSP